MTAETPIRAGRVPLVVLTLAKFVLNCALRLPYPFLGDVSRGLGMSTVEAGRLLGFGELAGLGSGLIGRDVDRGNHRRWTLVGLASSGVGAMILALFGAPWALVIGFAGISFGVSVFTTSGHGFLGDQVPVERRARAIGVYETSWAFALLIGAPICGLLIRRFSWEIPFAVVGLATLAMIPVVRWKMDAKTLMRNADHAADHAADRVADHAANQTGSNEPVRWIAVISAVSCSLLLTFAAVSTFSSFGPWLEDRHGFQTGGLGVIAVGIGVMELVGSVGTAAFADRIGQRRSVAIGAMVMAAGAGLLMWQGADSRVFAFLGVLVLFGGFEFGYVSLLSVVSEVGGRRRGMVVGIDHSLVTMTRAVGAGFGPWLARKGSTNFNSVQTMVIVLALASVAVVLAGGGRKPDPIRA